MKAAIYTRVSTDSQTTENQRQALETVIEQRGWTLKQVYEDRGISGAKGRQDRPALDRLLKDCVRGQYDVVMAWSIDRLGRSLSDLIATMQELNAAKVRLFVLQQGVDTTTPAGRAMFQMVGVFAEFERELIRERVLAGQRRAKAKGKHIGRRSRFSKDDKARVAFELDLGRKPGDIADEMGCGRTTIYRLAQEYRDEQRQQAPTARR